VTSLRCTAKLRRRLRLKELPEPEPSTAALGDWYANLFVVGRQPLVLGISERSLLAVVLRARDLRNLARHFRSALEERLRRLGAPEAAVESELAHLRSLALASATNRSVLGSMNDFVHLIKARAAYEPGWEWTVAELEEDLGDVPCAPIGYQRPRDLARALLESAATVLPGPWRTAAVNSRL